MAVEHCADCDRPAVRTLGTTSLCAWCHDRVVEEILTRRSDLRAPGVGFGVPTGGEGLPGGAPELRCGECGAGWFGSAWMNCPWCEERPEWGRQAQQSIDESRLGEYMADIRAGNDDAVVAACQLLKVAIKRGTLPLSAVHLLERTIRGAA